MLRREISIKVICEKVKYSNFVICTIITNFSHSSFAKSYHGMKIYLGPQFRYNSSHAYRLSVKRAKYILYNVNHWKFVR